MNISCERPYILYALLLIIPATLISMGQYIKVFRSMKFFSTNEHSVDGIARINNLPIVIVFRYIFRVLSWVMLVLACAGFSWGTYMEGEEKSKDAVSFVFDISYSMNARDCPGETSRLNASKNYASVLMTHLKDTCVSVVLAKGDGITVVPLTEDRVIVESLLENMSPSLMSSSGTSLGKGIRSAMKSFPDNSNFQGNIWVFTDGDETDNLLEPALSECIKKGFRVSIIGFGSETDIPVLAGDGKTYVSTSLKADRIKHIINNVYRKNNIEKTEGGLLSYVDASEPGSALRLLDQLSHRITSKEGSEVTISYEVRSVKRYKVFLCLAILFFTLAYIVSELDIDNISKKIKKGISFSFLIILFTSCSTDYEGGKGIMKGVVNWYQKNYNSAVSNFYSSARYAELSGDEKIKQYAVYDLAVTYLMQNETQVSDRRFKEIYSSNPELKYRTFYNMGIIAYKNGDYEEAKKCFKNALKVDGSRLDAKINLELSDKNAEKEVKLRENAMAEIHEDSSSSSIENAVFERIKENDRRQWKNSEKSEKITSANDY